MEQISSIVTNKQPYNTYKITFRKIARAAAAEVRVHKKLAIIAYVLYGVAFILFIFNADIHTYLGSGPRNVSFYPSGWGITFAVFGVLLTTFDVLNVFRDTGNQQLCDVGMALPIKASERFLSKLLCLVYIQIAPFTVAVLGGNGIAALIGALRLGPLEDEASKIIFTLFLIGLASSLFIIAITTLSACCCGALAESAYFSFIMMFIINGLPIAFILNIFDRSAGFTDSWFWLFGNSNMNLDLGFWGFLFFLNLEYDYVMLHAAIGSVISIAVTLLSGLIYIKRDARSVGTPISNKLFFEIMMAGACATVFSLTFMSSAVLWGVLIAVVAYIIINIIVSRAKINVLSFFKWIGKFALTLAVFTGIVVGCIKTGGFGYYRLRPYGAALEGASFTIYVTKYGTRYQHLRLSTDNLTAEQADEVMKVCKKYIQKGFRAVNPFSIIFDTHNVADIDIYADGNEMFLNCPSPEFMFKFGRYTGAGNYSRDGYYLDYYQNVLISPKVADEFVNELQQLDCIVAEDASPYGYTYTYD